MQKGNVMTINTKTQMRFDTDDCITLRKARRIISNMIDEINMHTISDDGDIVDDNSGLIIGNEKELCSAYSVLDTLCMVYEGYADWDGHAVVDVHFER